MSEEEEIAIYNINDTAERLDFPTTYENNELIRRVFKNVSSKKKTIVN